MNWISIVCQILTAIFALFFLWRWTRVRADAAEAAELLEISRATSQAHYREIARLNEAHANPVSARREPRPTGPFESAVLTAERPVWEQADAEAFRKFLGSPAGRKFTGILQFDEQKQNRSAVLRLNNHQYNCGFAAGFHARSASVQALSADVRPQQDEDQQPADGASAAAEQFAP